MPLFVDRTLETSTTTGTGALTLAGAFTAHGAFSARHIIGELVSYGIEAVDANGLPTGAWEIGYGTLTNAATLTRHVALESSNAGALVNFAAGTKRVWSNENAFLSGDQTLLLMSSVWNPAGHNTTVVSGVAGMAAMTITTGATATARGIAATNRLTRTVRLGYVSAATVNGFGGHVQNNQSRTIGDGTVGGFFYKCRFGCSDAATVAGARSFVGLRNSVSQPANTAEPTAGTNQMGVAVNSTGGNLQLTSAGATAQTPVDLGANFPGNTLSADLYDLTIIAPRTKANTVLYNVERVGTTNVASGVFPNGTPGTTLPAATTIMGHQAWRCNNATALACAIDIGTVVLNSEY
jgi:hypothetical protein